MSSGSAPPDVSSEAHRTSTSPRDLGPIVPFSPKSEIDSATSSSSKPIPEPILLPASLPDSKSSPQVSPASSLPESKKRSRPRNFSTSTEELVPHSPVTKAIIRTTPTYQRGNEVVSFTCTYDEFDARFREAAIIFNEAQEQTVELPTWAEKKIANEERYVRARERFLRVRFDPEDIHWKRSRNITPIQRVGHWTSSRYLRPILVPLELEGRFEQFGYEFSKKVLIWICVAAYLIWFIAINFTWRFLLATGLLAFLVDVIIELLWWYRGLFPLRHFPYLRNYKNFVLVAAAAQLSYSVRLYLLTAVIGGTAVMFVLKDGENKYWKYWKMKRDELKKSQQMAEERAEKEKLARQQREERERLGTQAAFEEAQRAFYLRSREYGQRLAAASAEDWSNPEFLASMNQDNPFVV